MALSLQYVDLHTSVLAAGAHTVVFTSFRDFMGLWDWLHFTATQHHWQGHRMPLLSKLKTGRKVYRFYELLSLKKTDRPEAEPAVEQLSSDVADIYPREIEDVLYELQEVAEVAFTAWFDEAGQQQIVAFIVPRQSSGHAGGLDTVHLHQWCAVRLPPESRPVHFKMLTHLPRTPTGKVMRRAWRGLVQLPAR